MQIVKYSWKPENGEFEPALAFSDGSRRMLLGSSISMDIGEKVCTGYSVGGKRHECPHSMRMEYGYMCNECRMNDDFFNCMQCTGKECINTRQRDSCEQNKYFIYLAAFSKILKVGISFDRRLQERLVEQGADFGAKVACVTDGKEVRLIEQEMRKHLGIVDRVMSKEKHNNLFCDPNSCIETISSAVGRLRNNGFNEHLIMPEIYDLRSYYRMENISSDPVMKEVFSGMRIDGVVEAAKGNMIIIRNGQGFYSINAHRLIGRLAKVNC